MPERVLRKVWAYFDALGPLTGGIEWPITYRQEEAERAALLRAFGVRAFTAMLYPHKPGMARWLNDWAAGFARRTPTACTPPPSSPSPAPPPTSARPSSRGRASSRRMCRSARTTRPTRRSTPAGAARRGGRPRGGPLRLGSRPRQAHRTRTGRPCAGPPSPAAARRGPHGHARVRGLPRPGRAVPGGPPGHHHGVHRLQRADGAVPRRALPRLAALGDRVLLGTDFPNIPYPYAHQLDALAGLGLGDDWLRAVCHDNAARLFGLPDAPEPAA